MKSSLRRALDIADEIESFKWAGSPDSDPDGIYYSVHHLRELAIRLRVAAQLLGSSSVTGSIEEAICRY
jgi:hypothetical protein